MKQWLIKLRWQPRLPLWGARHSPPPGGTSGAHERQCNRVVTAPPDSVPLRQQCGRSNAQKPGAVSVSSPDGLPMIHPASSAAAADRQDQTRPHPATPSHEARPISSTDQPNELQVHGPSDASHRRSGPDLLWIHLDAASVRLFKLGEMLAAGERLGNSWSDGQPLFAPEPVRVVWIEYDIDTYRLILVVEPLGSHSVATDDNA